MGRVGKDFTYAWARVDGAADIEKALLQLERKVARKAILTPLRDGAKIIMRRAKEICPVGPHSLDHRPGALRDSIKVRSGKKSKNFLEIVVGPHSGWFKGDQFYGGFIEYGTDERFHESGKSVGAIPPIAFVKQALDDTKDVVLSQIMRQTSEGIMALVRGEAV